MRRSSRAWAAARRMASATISARPSAISSKASSEWRAGRRSGGRERGADLRYNMEITLEEAFSGKTAQVHIPTPVTCEACSGTGAKAGSKPKNCAMCGGAGRIRQAQGFFQVERTCPTCHGRGQTIEDPCPLHRLRPRHARAGAVGEYSCRRGGWHAHSSFRRRRGGRARRAAGRPLHLPVARAA